MENKTKDVKTNSWWNKKSKEQKKFFIVDACIWTVGLVVLLLILLSKDIFGQDFFGGTTNGFVSIGEWFVNYKDALIKTAVSIVVAWMIVSIIGFISKGVANKGSHKVATVMSLVRSLLKWVVVIIAIFVILSYWNVDTSTLLASLGIVALVVGLGCQSLIKDVVAGMFLVFDSAFDVGDMVTINGFRGKVIDVGIKSTRLEDAGGNIKIISNSEISTVVNLSKELSVAVVEIPVSYNEDITHVEAVISKNLDSVKKSVPGIVEGPFYKGVSNLGDSMVSIKFVAKCKEDDYYQVQRDLNRAFYLLFVDNHIDCKNFDQVVINEPNLDTQKASKSDEKKAEAFSKEQAESSKGLEPVNK
jgi:small-conductance mechanosensitive channel